MQHWWSWSSDHCQPQQVYVVDGTYHAAIAPGAVLSELAGAEIAVPARREGHVVGGALAAKRDVLLRHTAVDAGKRLHAAALEVSDPGCGHAGGARRDARAFKQVCKRNVCRTRRQRCRTMQPGGEHQRHHVLGGWLLLVCGIYIYIHSAAGACRAVVYGWDLEALPERRACMHGCG